MKTSITDILVHTKAINTFITDENYIMFFKGFIYACNEDIIYKAKLPKTMEDMPNISVLAKPFISFFDRLGQNHDKTLDVTFMYDQNTLVAELKKRRLKAKFTSIETPITILAPARSKKTWKILPDNFCIGLDFCFPACFEGSESPALTCLNIMLRDGVIQATDKNRLAEYVMDYTIDIEDFLLPSQTAKYVIKFGAAQIAVTEGWVHFRTDTSILTCRTYTNVNFPDIKKYQDDIKGLKNIGIVLPHDIKEALNVISIFAKDPENDQEMLDFVIDENSFTISTQKNNSFGMGEVFLEAKQDDPSFPGPIHFVLTKTKSIQYILDFSKSCDILLDANAAIFRGEKWLYAVGFFKGDQK